MHNQIERSGTGAVNFGGTGSVSMGGTGSVSTGGTGSVSVGGTGSVAMGGTGKVRNLIERSGTGAILFALVTFLALGANTALARTVFEGQGLTVSLSDDLSEAAVVWEYNKSFFIGTNKVESGFTTVELHNRNMLEKVAGSGTGEDKVAGSGTGEQKVAGSGTGEQKVAGSGTGEEKVAGSGTGEDKVAGSGTGEDKLLAESVTVELIVADGGDVVALLTVSRKGAVINEFVYGLSAGNQLAMVEQVTIH